VGRSSPSSGQSEPRGQATAAFREGHQRLVAGGRSLRVVWPTRSLDARRLRTFEAEHGATAVSIKVRV
jgi:hypothetical protein